MIGLPLQELPRLPLAIGVAAGPPDKAEAVLAALRGRLLHVLVTDTATAQRALDLDATPASDRARRPRTPSDPPTPRRAPSAGAGPVGRRLGAAAVVRRATATTPSRRAESAAAAHRPGAAEIARRSRVGEDERRSRAGPLPRRPDRSRDARRGTPRAARRDRRGRR